MCWVLIYMCGALTALLQLILVFSASWSCVVVVLLRYRLGFADPSAAHSCLPVRYIHIGIPQDGMKAGCFSENE